jgi:hypothetical protein
MTGNHSPAYQDRSTILTSYHITAHIQEITRRSNENGGAQIIWLVSQLSHFPARRAAGSSMLYPEIRMSCAFGPQLRIRSKVERLGIESPQSCG